MSLQPLEYYDTNIPCLAACPVNTNAGLYVAAIADGEDERAYLTARMPNPFSSICGRVCAAPCEDACRRGEIDRPIAIRALKRYLTEQFGPETGNPLPASISSPAAKELPQHIGIVGGGPAGMACAHDLRKHGYQVTVYEATDKLGGAMWLGIPEYRLDRDVMNADLDAIVDMGVTVKYNTLLGKDVTLHDLRERHDAVFLAIGATLGRGLDIEGGDSDGVLKAIEFLINMNRGYEVELGNNVLVIGGGDVAMDAARTALRAQDYGSPEPGQGTQSAASSKYEAERQGMQEALDVARTIARRKGEQKVTVMSLEAREEMPAHDFEIEEALHEDITFLNRRGPKRILSKNGRVSGIETIGVNRVFDEEGRFSPEFNENDTKTLEFDTIILAIGQAIDIDSLGEDGPEISPRRTINIDWDTGATSLADVWSGGDAAKGPRTLIDAIADGRRSAADIHKSFGGILPEAETGTLVELTRYHRLDDHYDSEARVAVPTLATGRRTGLAEVELGFTPEQARCEAARCLRCFANIMLDTESCVLCGLCADICPVDVISLVPGEKVSDEEEAPQATALLLDETACIRCGLCIERCPPKALSMGVWSGVGVPS